MSSTVIGTCSLCQGAVSIPRLWSGTIPPIPTCERCGATKKQPFGAVIEMEPGKAPAPDTYPYPANKFR